MTWAAFASLVSGKTPVWLYDVTVGGTVTRITSTKGGFTYGGNSYAEAAVRHGRMPDRRAVKLSSVAVIFPQSSGLAQSIRDSEEYDKATIVIRHGFAEDGDAEFVQKFSGRVVSVKPMLGTISLTVESATTKGRRGLVGRVMQRDCPHVLYRNPGCRVNIADVQTSGTATAWASPVLTVTEAASQADGYYRGGVVTFGTERRMIRSHVGSALTLLSPVPGLAAEIASSGTASVSIAPGCDRTTATCIARFANIGNHGGFPAMTENPFDGRDLS